MPFVLLRFDDANAIVYYKHTRYPAGPIQGRGPDLAAQWLYSPSSSLHLPRLLGAGSSSSDGGSLCCILVGVEIIMLPIRGFASSDLNHRKNPHQTKFQIPKRTTLPPQMHVSSPWRRGPVHLNWGFLWWRFGPDMGVILVVLAGRHNTELLDMCLQNIEKTQVVKRRWVSFLMGLGGHSRTVRCP